MRCIVVVLFLGILSCSANSSERSSASPPAGPESVAAPVPGPESVAAPVPVEFRGFYSAGFEQELFQPCGSSERWWVARAGPLRQHYEALGARPYEPIYAVVRGDTTPLGHAGHLGLYQRYVSIVAVDSARRIDPPSRAGVLRCP
jgi:hypothetical protein